jgi:hypothetical protein
MTLIASDRRSTSRLRAINPSRQKTHQGLRADDGWLYRLLAFGDSALEVIDAAREVEIRVGFALPRPGDPALLVAEPSCVGKTCLMARCICISQHSALAAEMDGAQIARVS